MVNKIKLGDIATVITKGTTPTSLGFSFVEDGINFVKIESINEDGTFIPEKFAHINSKCNEKLKRSQLQENDVLFSIAGAIGRTAIVTKDILPANTNQALAIIRIPNGVVDYKYLIYALESDSTIEQANKNKQGVAQLNLSLQNINDFVIPLFTEEKQKEIVSSLSLLDDLISARKEQLSKLDELVKSRFIEMFGDVQSNPNNYPIKNFDEISILITDGEHSTPRRTENGIYLLSARNVLNHALQLNDVDYINEDEYDRIARRVVPQKGDVLISCSGSIGRCCVVPEGLKFQMVRSAALIRFNESINPVFAEWLITSDDLQQQIAQSATQSSQANLFQGKIRKLHCYIPPINLQNEFASFVEQTDKLKCEVKESLEKLETLKKSLMQKYFI